MLFSQIRVSYVLFARRGRVKPNSVQMLHGTYAAFAHHYSKLITLNYNNMRKRRSKAAQMLF